ncbi:MAG: WecB/TagA/CpsF family glycosyltransferase [Thiohalomonas sp.]|nr:WecB/TagA/CpsF family glycosyltransferase [Thiohalomonas sp.]
MYDQTEQLPEVMILGTPIDNLSLDSTVHRILSMIKDYQFDWQPKQVVTVNVDFLMNSLSWFPFVSARHPELLDILRNADLATADGMPIVWLSRLLNAPLQARVTGADMVPALAKKFAQTGHSIYFLGGNGDIGQQAADKLIKDYPGLNVVGVDSPFVYTEGEKMLTADERDKVILEKINKVKPDVLLIGFGNPKQELWFNRNSHKLKAAVTIGIGGTYEFIVGNVSRAPLWVQKSAFEWLYRILQDPKRLWKRYAIAIPKLGVLTIPLLLSNLLQRKKNRELIHDKKPYPCDIVQGWNSYEVKVKLSKRLDSQSMQVFIDNWENYSCEYKNLIFDFIDVEMIDSNALGMLVRFYKRLQKNQVNVSSIGLINDDIVRLLKLTHVWDLINESEERNNLPLFFSEKNKNLNNNKHIIIAEQNEKLTIASLVGRLDGSAIALMNFDESIKLFGDGDCILDLSSLSFLDSTGLKFFFHLQRDLKKRNKQMILINPTETITQLLEITKLHDFFKMNDSKANAILSLSNPA